MTCCRETAEYNYYADLTVANLPNCTSTSVPPAPPQGTENNGNVWGYLDQDNWDAAFCHAETYTYDNVNRLATAQATTPTSCASGTSTYGPISYNYDAYGNMTCTTSASNQKFGNKGLPHAGSLFGAPSGADDTSLGRENV
jgi:hypothetical protein